MVTAQSAVSQA